ASTRLQEIPIQCQGLPGGDRRAHLNRPGGQMMRPAAGEVRDKNFPITSQRFSRETRQKSGAWITGSDVIRIDRAPIRGPSASQRTGQRGEIVPAESLPVG